MRCVHPICVWLACLALLVGMLSPRAVQAAPRAQQASATLPVYGIQGRFEAVPGSAFGEVFAAADGTRLTVVGVNATVAQQIDVLARQSPPPAVKVWGTRTFDPKPDYVADLVVSEILPEGDTAQPAPQPTQAPSSGTPPAPDVTAVVNFSLVNLYNTPSQSMSVVGQARAGERCNLQGRDGTGTWLLVDCGGTAGWIDRRLVNVTGNLQAVAVTDREVAPKPTPAPLQLHPRCIGLQGCAVMPVIAGDD